MNDQSTLTALDDYDRAILSHLQLNNTTPQRVIGEAVHLSAPAVQRRIRRLEKSAVIVSNVAVLDPASLGHPLTILVGIELESERVDRIDALKRRFAEAPEVQQCYYVTGEVDFLLVVSARSMADYEALTRRLFFADENIRRFRSMVVMDRVKVGMTVPV